MLVGYIGNLLPVQIDTGDSVYSFKHQIRVCFIRAGPIKLERVIPVAVSNPCQQPLVVVQEWIRDKAMGH